MAVLLFPRRGSRDGERHAANGILGRQPQVRLLHHGRGNDFGRFAVGHQRAVGQHDDAVGQFAHHVHLVLHQQNGLAAILLEFADQVQDHRRLVMAHARRGLVEHIDLRLQRHEQRHLQLALVAVRQGRNRLIAPRPQRHLLQDLLRARQQCAVVAPDAPEVHAAPVRALARGLHGQAHVLQHRQGREQIRELKGPPRPARARRRRQAREVAPLQRHLPSVARSCPEIRLK
jgi:hypothetical protein